LEFAEALKLKTYLIETVMRFRLRLLRTSLFIRVEGIEPDTVKYLMLYSSAANLLNFEGYTTKSICKELQGQKQKDLTLY
jgi:hypothetical protein